MLLARVSSRCIADRLSIHVPFVPCSCCLVQSGGNHSARCDRGRRRTTRVADHPLLSFQPKHLVIHASARSLLVAHRAGLTATTCMTPGMQLRSSQAPLARSSAHTAVARGRYRGDRMALKRSLVSASGEQRLLGPKHCQRAGSARGIGFWPLSGNTISLADRLLLLCMPSSDFSRHRRFGWTVPIELFALTCSSDRGLAALLFSK